MIKITTQVRCDKCGKVIYTHEGNVEKVKGHFRTYGWTFIGLSAYCKQCTKKMDEQDGEEV